MLYNTSPCEAQQIALFFIPVSKQKNANKFLKIDKGGNKPKTNNKLHNNMTREKLLSCSPSPPFLSR